VHTTAPGILTSLKNDLPALILPSNTFDFSHCEQIDPHDDSVDSSTLVNFIQQVSVTRSSSGAVVKKNVEYFLHLTVHTQQTHDGVLTPNGHTPNGHTPLCLKRNLYTNPDDLPPDEGPGDASNIHTTVSFESIRDDLDEWPDSISGRRFAEFQCNALKMRKNAAAAGLMRDMERPIIHGEFTLQNMPFECTRVNLNTRIEVDTAPRTTAVRRSSSSVRGGNTGSMKLDLVRGGNTGPMRTDDSSESHEAFGAGSESPKPREQRGTTKIGAMKSALRPAKLKTRAQVRRHAQNARSLFTPPPPLFPHVCGAVPLAPPPLFPHVCGAAPFVLTCVWHRPLCSHMCVAPPPLFPHVGGAAPFVHTCAHVCAPPPPLVHTHGWAPL